jgi:O-antigen/teichoic acid export membrane protein/glycosyltransferase involved in cell wall biosynthesis
VSRCRIAVIPKDPSPYLELLYGAMRASGADVRYAGALTRSRTLNLLLLPLELLCLRLRSYRILHLHWTFGFRFPILGRTRAGGVLSRLWFMLVLRTAGLLGMRIVWTAHNKLPHAPVFDDDVRARRFLIANANLLIVHSPQALTALGEFGEPIPHHAVVPHGPIGPDALRRLPAPLPGPRRTIAFFGRIAAYKGVEELLAALGRTNADVALIVAGACPSQALRERLTAAAGADPRVTLRLGHLSDQALIELIEEADALVFPFREITTSGSLLLGMSAARLAIVPRLSSLADLPRTSVLTYEPGEAGLSAALRAVASLSSAAITRGGLAARDAVSGPSWDEIAAQTRSEFDATLTRPSALGRLRENHLLTGSATLLVNTALLAILGFAFWAIAARLFHSSSVGIYSGINSLSTLLGSVAALGCPIAVIRFLPGEPHQRRLAMMMILAVLLLGTCIVIVVELIAAPILFPTVHIPQTFTVGLLTLLLVVVSSVGAVTDAALISERQTLTVLVKNAIGGVLKIVILFPLAGLGTTGLTSAATIGGVVASVLGFGALWRRLRPSAGPWHELDRALEYIRYSLTGYVSVLIGILPSTVVPLIVLGVLGESEAGYFSMAFLIGGLLSFVPSTAAQVLFAEGSRTPAALRGNTITALKAIYSLLLPGALMLGVLAPWILGLLGGGYAAHAGTALRLLAAGSVFLGFTYIIDSILTAIDRMKSFLAINSINSALVVVMVAFVAHRGLTAVALGWDAAQGLSVLFGLAILTGPRLLRRRPLVDVSLANRSPR